MADTAAMSPIVFCGTSLFIIAVAAGIEAEDHGSVMHLRPHAPELGRRLAALQPALVITEPEFLSLLIHLVPPLTSPLLSIDMTRQTVTLIRQRHLGLNAFATLRQMVDEAHQTHRTPAPEEG